MVACNQSQVTWVMNVHYYKNNDKYMSVFILYICVASPWNPLVQLELAGQSLYTFYIVMYLVILSFRKIIPIIHSHYNVGRWLLPKAILTAGCRPPCMYVWLTRRRKMRLDFFLIFMFLATGFFIIIYNVLLHIPIFKNYFIYLY